MLPTPKANGGTSFPSLIYARCTDSINLQVKFLVAYCRVPAPTQPMNPISDQQSNITSDVEITGSISFKGDLIFDGQLKGGNITGQLLTIGSKSRIQGNIEADALTLHGAVTGDVLVSGKCELKGSANLVGSLTTNRLVMDEGATFIGQAEITPESTKQAVPPLSPRPNR